MPWLLAHSLLDCGCFPSLAVISSIMLHPAWHTLITIHSAIVFNNPVIRCSSLVRFINYIMFANTSRKRWWQNLHTSCSILPSIFAHTAIAHTRCAPVGASVRAIALYNLQRSLTRHPALLFCPQTPYMVFASLTHMLYGGKTHLSVFAPWRSRALIGLSQYLRSRKYMRQTCRNSSIWAGSRARPPSQLQARSSRRRSPSHTKKKGQFWRSQNILFFVVLSWVS